MAVVFHPHDHTYWNEQGIQYLSVTTLIKKYTPPFDEDYWSSYKALKDVLSRAGVWSVYKERAGGWEFVLDYCRKIPNFPYRDAIIQRKKYYVADWRQNGEDARERGTSYHNKAEQTTKLTGLVLDDKREVEVISGKDILSAPDMKALSLHPELLLYNDKYRIAGTADWVLRDGGRIKIKDYKTSREISKEAFREETLYAPLTDLPNANYYTYSLQLSIYAFMCECKGYKIDGLSIEHVVNEYETIIHPITYLRKEVHALLKDYDHQRKNQQRKNQFTSGESDRIIVPVG